MARSAHSYRGYQRNFYRQNRSIRFWRLKEFWRNANMIAGLPLRTKRAAEERLVMAKATAAARLLRGWSGLGVQEAMTEALRRLTLARASAR
jgi:hypothetical protein